MASITSRGRRLQISSRNLGLSAAASLELLTSSTLLKKNNSKEAGRALYLAAVVMVTAAGLWSRGGGAALGALATPSTAGAADAPSAPNTAAVPSWSPRVREDTKSAAKLG